MPDTLSTAVPKPLARRLGRRQALLGATVGLAAGYALGAVGLAPSTQAVDWSWPGRFDVGGSLLLAAGAVYAGAWLGGGWAGVAILHRGRRAGWTGAAVGAGTLLAATLAAAGSNFGQEALRYWPLPGTTAADFNQHLRDTASNYVGKPLAWVLPLGLPAAALLGAALSGRIRRAGQRQRQ